MKGQRIQYRRSSITVHIDCPIRKGICEACGRKGLTHLHHYKYEFSTKEVRKDPELALKNVIELCYSCHQIGDSLRIVEHNIGIANKILKLIENKPEINIVI